VDGAGLPVPILAMVQRRRVVESGQ
jgi:hypothetical protein